MSNKGAPETAFTCIFMIKTLSSELNLAVCDLLFMQVMTLITCTHGFHVLAFTIFTGCHENVSSSSLLPLLPENSVLFLCYLKKKKKERLIVELNL